MNHEFTKSTINMMKEGKGKEFFKKAYATKSKALAKKKEKEPMQVSKEYHKGKYRKVGFYEGKDGKVTVRPIK